jgi:hypothetical protein
MWTYGVLSGWRLEGLFILELNITPIRLSLRWKIKAT